MNQQRTPDEGVLTFIEQFLMHEGKENSEVIRHLFRAGYCYYFALMLQEAFQRGIICVAYPFGHIVWVDGKNEHSGVAYDIEGVYEGEAEEFIPVEYLGDTIEDFMHVPGKTAFANKTQVSSIYNNYMRRSK